MANVEHSSLTGASLHEPKGAASASADQIMTADGAGSTSWGFFSPHYGELYTTDSDSATLSTIGTTRQTFPFANAGESNGVTVSAASNNITVAKTGVYYVVFSISFSTAAAGDAGLYNFHVAVNGTETTIEAYRQMSGSSDTGAFAVAGLLTLSAGDILTVKIGSDEAGDTDDISISYANLMTYLIRQTA